MSLTKPDEKKYVSIAENSKSIMENEIQNLETLNLSQNTQLQPVQPSEAVNKFTSEFEEMRRSFMDM